jgi:hypothetical protein
MQALKAVLAMDCAILFASCLAAQTVQINGTIKDANGTFFKGALITVKDPQGKLLGNGISDGLGNYKASAALGAVTVACEIAEDPSKYSKNPEVETLTITANAARKDFTFYQVTTLASYWKTVSSRIDTQATKAPDASLRYVLLKFEWRQIESSGLPPDSKAAAAHQLGPMRWSAHITDPKFKDYVTVDESTLSKALNGDQIAFSKLPTSVAKDVKASTSGVEF